VVVPHLTPPAAGLTTTRLDELLEPLEVPLHAKARDAEEIAGVTGTFTSMDFSICEAMMMSPSL
jgi:hypothetical protein